MWEGALGQTNFRQGRLLRPYRHLSPLGSRRPYVAHIFKYQPEGKI